MAVWRAENSMLTQKGVEILNKVKAGIGDITITRIVAGSGRVAESTLFFQTSVSGTTKPMILSQASTQDSGSELSIYITNSDFTELFSLNQIGVYVTHPDYLEEQLYHISQCDASGFDTIPVFEETPVTFGYSLFLEHGNSESINITVDTQGMVSVQDFNDYKVSVENRISNLTYNDVGAIPSGHIEVHLNEVNSAEDLDTRLDSVLSNMKNGSVKFVRVTFYKVHPILGGGDKILRIDKVSNSYCTVHSRGYPTDSSIGGSVDFTRSKVNGVWTSWARNYNTAYKPTLTELGAAPSGYGLGVLGNATKHIDTQAEFYSINENRWFWFGSETDPIIISGNSIKYAYGRVDTYDSDYMRITLYPVVPNIHSALTRVKSGGAWGQWEWVNPPMNTSVEYRTTERYQGVAVYKKVSNGGNILWRKENETEWRTTSNSLVHATVE